MPERVWTDFDLEAAYKAGFRAADAAGRGNAEDSWWHSETRKETERAKRRRRQETKA